MKQKKENEIKIYTRLKRSMAPTLYLILITIPIMILPPTLFSNWNKSDEDWLIYVFCSIIVLFLTFVTILYYRTATLFNESEMGRH
jgi:Ca2+/H+ antiporter